MKRLLDPISLISASSLPMANSPAGIHTILAPSLVLILRRDCYAGWQYAGMLFLRDMQRDAAEADEGFPKLRQARVRPATRSKAELLSSPAPAAQHARCPGGWAGGILQWRIMIIIRAIPIRTPLPHIPRHIV